METIQSLRGSHTVLLTTHNLENVVSADKIVVMEDGKIAETGTYDELIGRQGLFYRLNNAGDKHSPC